MQSYLISALVNALLVTLNEDLIKRVVDQLLDGVEDVVADSTTQTDDALLLPLVARIRSALNVPDND